MATISIIVPAYNVEKYLKRCILSILCQDFTDFEILLIDDGSTDNTGRLCDEFCEKDSRVKVFHKKNGGLSDARNFGLDKNESEFITFIDSDDYVSAKYLGTLYNMMKDKDVQISMVPGQQLTEAQEPKKYVVSECECFKTEDAVRMMLQRIEITHTSWGKLYKSNLWDNVRFPVGQNYEDYATTYQVFGNAENVAYCDAKLYYYIQRNGSIMHAACAKKTLTVLNVADKVTEFIAQKWPDNTIYAIDLKIAVYMKNLQAILNTGFDAFPQEQERIVKTVKENAKYILTTKDVPRNDKVKIVLLLVSKKLFLRLYNKYDGDISVKG